MNLDEIGRKLVAIEGRLSRMENSPRLSHASIDDTSVQVRDGDGNLRGLLGVQADGTTAVNIVNGPPPPAPSTPILASVLGGITASWDGTFADGAVMPLDWQRIEVHASTLDGFTPAPETLRGTIETPQGSTVVVATDDPVYVRLLARSTSGTASTASAQAGPAGPTQVVPTDGTVTELKLADGAVTEAKVATNAITTTKISDDAVTTPKIIAGAVQAGQIAAEAVNASKIASGAVTTAKLDALAVTTDKLAANSVVAGKIAAGAVSTNELTVGIAQSIVTKLTDAMGDATAWTQTIGTGTWAILTGVTDAAAGGTVAEGSGPVSLERSANIPYDPDTLYRVTGRVRTTVAPSAGSPVVSIGLVGVAADGTTKVSSTGANNSVTGQHYIAAAGVTVPVGTAWTTFTGYVQGTAATGTTTACPDPRDPGKMHTNVRYVRPSVRLLTGATGGTMQIDQVTVETVPTGVVNSVNIANGAITANALAADAITGKTITGGTITGTVIQTATSGERVTINESNANKVLVYDATGRAVAELSGIGLGLVGTGGALMVLDPDAIYPALRMTNAAGTNEAVINVSENTAGAADIGINSGLFTGSGFTDMKWRTFFGNDFWAAERVRNGTTTTIGGRVLLNNDRATIGYLNTADVASTNTLFLYAGYSQFNGSRLEVLAPASASSALYVNANSGHTGNLLRLLLNGVEKFAVTKDGDAAIGGILSAGNVAAGRVSIVPTINVPTSVNVTGLNLKGTNIRVMATAATSVPGTQVTGVGVTNQSSTGFTVWVTRTNTNTTFVDWLAFGV
jgi:hypothetical protein